MLNRMCICFFTFALTFCLLLGRIADIINDEDLKAGAVKQSESILSVANCRGTIYDRDFKPLVNESYKFTAAVDPNNFSADALFRNLPKEETMHIKEKLNTHLPFTIDVPNDDIYSYGIDIFEVPKRYKERQTAVHIIGETSNGQRDGISGLEKAYDNLLKANGGEIYLKYPSDGLNHSFKSAAPKIFDSMDKIKGGIVTTLDKDIQLLAEEAGRNIKKGAIVVASPQNGDILACASFPVYDPNNIEKSLKDPSEPLINRAFYPFAVGSTFKLLTAATALEEGLGLNYTYNCRGYIDVGSNRFHCHKLQGHGKLNMVEALERSCNPYFINLSQNIHGQSLLNKAKLMLFGENLPLAPGYFTMSGSLPDERDLFAKEALGNFAFGQGELLATPIQVSSLISTIANGGKFYVPRLIEGSTTDGVNFSNHTARYEETDVIHPNAADDVRRMMVSVVENGSGKKAKPEFLGAGGKTASAQSGQFKDGNEIVHAWFSGFYPAEEPKYTIVVLCEGAYSGQDAAAPVFKEICDGIYKLKGESFLKSKIREPEVK